MTDKTIKLSNKQLIKASKTFGKFLQEIGFEDYLNDPHMADTPMRVTKAYVEDLFKGMYTDAPKITAFENSNGYDGIVFQGDIEVKSCCSHHFLPFVGKAHVAYIPGADGKVIGLSKLNRIVEWFARRPQVQENLTMQVHDFINNTCNGNKGVSVMIEAKHMCASCRGVRHDSTMMTSKLSGGFMDDAKVRDEFYNFVKRLDK
jgi:GTP cyclohydrolase I